MVCDKNAHARRNVLQARRKNPDAGQAQGKRRTGHTSGVKKLGGTGQQRVQNKRRAYQQNVETEENNDDETANHSCPGTLLEPASVVPRNMPSRMRRC